MKSYRFVKLTTFALIAVSAISLAATGFLVGSEIKNGRLSAQAEDCPGMPSSTLSVDQSNVVLKVEGNLTGQKVYFFANLTLPDGTKVTSSPSTIPGTTLTGAINGSINHSGPAQSGSYFIPSKGTVVAEITMNTEDNLCVVNKTEQVYVGTPTLSACGDYEKLKVAIPEGMKKKKDEQISFNITNPNQDRDVYVEVELSNGAGDYKTINSLFKLDKNTEKIITLTPASNPDRITEFGRRTIRVSTYNDDQKSCSVSQQTTDFEYIPNSGQSDAGTFTATGTAENPAIGNTTISKTGNTTIGGVVARVISFLVLIIGALAFVSICVSGLQYITSAGDSAKAEKAKKTLLYSVLGMVLAILSFTLLWIIVNELQK